jgi:hypothetical protein
MPERARLNNERDGLAARKRAPKADPWAWSRFHLVPLFPKTNERKFLDPLENADRGNG